MTEKPVEIARGQVTTRQSTHSPSLRATKTVKRLSASSKSEFPFKVSRTLQRLRCRPARRFARSPWRQRSAICCAQLSSLSASWSLRGTGPHGHWDLRVGAPKPGTTTSSGEPQDQWHASVQGDPALLAGPVRSHGLSRQDQWRTGTIHRHRTCLQSHVKVVSHGV